jgi:hypothetical protein
VSPDKDMVQHGANDDYRPTYDEDGNVTSVEGGDKQGRTPDKDEKFVAVEPDGTVKEIDGTDNLQDYYDQNGMDWPY